MKKILSIVLALCMVLSVLAVPAFAADPATTIGADAETAGYIAPTPTVAKGTYTKLAAANLTAAPTSGNFEIQDADDWMAFENYANVRHFSFGTGVKIFQTDNIDLTGKECQGIANYTGRGMFQGTYDGQGYTISNMTIKPADGKWKSCAMFGLTMNGTCLKNIYMDSTCKIVAPTTFEGNDNRGIGSISAWLHVKASIVNCYSAATIQVNHTHNNIGVAGGIVGKATSAASFGDTQINNCTFAGRIEAPTYTRMGGILGRNESNYISITSCVNEGTINGLSHIGGVVGGVIGVATITNCINNGSPKANTTGDGHLGGFAAIVESAATLTIENCTNNGVVSTAADKFVGGFVGDVLGICNLSNSKNTGAVSGVQFVGGIIGQVNGKDKTSTVQNCINTGSVTVSNQDAAGIVGNVAQAVTIKNCSNMGAITSKNCAGGIASRSWASVLTVENCVNKGIINGAIKGGIVAQTVDTDTINTKIVFKNNINYQAGDLFGVLAADEKDVETGNVSKATDAWTVGYQVTKVEGEKQNLRIVASIDSVEYQNVGFNITVTDKTGAEVKKIENFNCEYVYTELTAIGELDNKIDVAKVRPNGYLYALNIQQIPVAAGELTFTVQSYAVAKDGTTVIGETITFTHTVGNV